MSNTPDLTALFKISYGLYVITCNDGIKDTGCIVNTPIQVTNTPNRIAVTINKTNYTYEVVKKTGKMNVNCLTVEAPFSVFENFGFKSGRISNKFDGISAPRAKNGIAYLPNHINAYLSLETEKFIDLDTHVMFICKLTDAEVLSNVESMTYAYYHANVKPKPQAQKKKGYVCKICGYVYEGEELPEDFICPLCKHPASDFEPIK